MPKAPEWLSADIQEFYPACQGNIKAIQRAIRGKRGVEIAYMTITDRMKRLGLERPRDKQKASKDTSALRASEPSEPETAHTAVDGAMSAIANIDPVNTGDIDTLSPDETETLQYCEHVIAEGIQTFVDVGRALLVIRDQRLYRQSHATFEVYCRERWELSRTYAYQLVEASQVVDHVSAVSDVVPANEAQARPLASLPPERQVKVWQEAVETAPPSGITAAHVKRTVARVKAKADGVSTPHQPLSWSQETAQRMTQRERPNGSWINVLSQAQRLSSSLWRSPERDAVFDSWGPEGRQKAIEYLAPLHKTVGNLLKGLEAIEASKRG
jgi:hypothetical protein